MKKIVTMILSAIFAISLIGGFAFLGGGGIQAEQTVVAETVNLGPTKSTAADFGVTENPNNANTNEQYIWDASAAGKLYSFMPTYIISKQTTWSGDNTNARKEALVGIHLAAPTKSFASSQVNATWKVANNNGYIYYGHDYDTADADLQASGAGYVYDGKGGNGWLAYVANVKENGANINPKKVVFKKGFTIVMSDGTVYALEKDVPVYNINGGYLSARTTDEFLETAVAAEPTKNVTANVKITDVSYSNNQLTVTTDTNLLTAPGNYGIVSESIKINGENLSTWSGYVNTNNTKQLIYKNLSKTLQEGDELLISQGFTSLWGNSTWIYAVKTTEEYRVSYVNGSFMKQGTRDWYIWNAQFKGVYNEITPNAITSIQSSDSTNTLKNNGGVSIFIDTDKNLATTNIAWQNNAGYIYYGTTYDDNNLKVSTNGDGKQATGYAFSGAGGVGKAVYIMNVKQNSYNASKPAKVVLKAGFMLALTDGTVFSLKEDYTLYNVNGSYLPAPSVEKLQEKYTTTLVDAVAIKYVTPSDSFYTFGTDKMLFDPKSNPCGTFGSLTLNNSPLSTWSGYVISGSSQFVLSGISSSVAVDDVLTMTDFSAVFYSVAENKFYVVKANE